MSNHQHRTVKGSCGHIISQCRCGESSKNVVTLSTPCNACQRKVKEAFVKQAQIKCDIGWGEASALFDKTKPNGWM